MCKGRNFRSCGSEGGRHGLSDHGQRTAEGGAEAGGRGHADSGSLFLYLAEGKPAQAIAEAGGVRTAVSGETAQHAPKAADTARIVSA